MSKMALHRPFGYLQHKLWQKEGPRAKLPSWPLKVRNRPDPDVCRWIATHHWKAFEESYKFVLDLISIRGLSKKLWPRKILGVQTRTVLRLLLGSLGVSGQKTIWMWVPQRGIDYTIWGKVVVSPESKPWWILWV